MRFLLDHPVIFFLALLVLFWAATHIGAALEAWRGPLDNDRRADFDIVLGATLTLLSLIVGFSFSMAASRYDQRKSLEESEANAIGTAYARADLLPSADSGRVHGLLREYTTLRVRFYTVNDTQIQAELSRATDHAQAQLWAATVAPASTAPSPVMSLVLASMNDAINSQGYAQAAMWNRIPTGAWVLLCTIAVAATTLLGFRFHRRPRLHMLRLVTPILIATSLFMIADIDCPRNGVIRVIPQNLMALQATLH